MNSRILVTDGHDPAALGVVRALGRAGHQVVVSHLAGDATPACLSSRYCSGGRIQPDAGKRQTEFCSWLAERAGKEGLAAVVPISAATRAACADQRGELPDSLLLLISAAGGFPLPNDRPGWFRIALNTGIPVPKVWVPRGSEGWSQDVRGESIKSDALQFPAVLRIDRRQDYSGPYLPGRTYFCASLEELDCVLDAVTRRNHSISVQEYLPGRSEFALLLRHQGNVRMQFAYQPIPGEPRWGSAATRFEAVENASLFRDASRLLEACGYEGLAGLEFRYDKNGRRCFVSVEPNPWPGAVVALDAGRRAALHAYENRGF